MFLFKTRRPAARPRASSSAIAPLLTSATRLLLLAVLVGAPSSAQAQDQALKQPKLTIDEVLYDAGEVARDQVVEHTFKIRNSGDAALTILDVILPPNLEIVSRPTSLRPGEAGEIHVRVPLLYDKPEALIKQIQLLTNDPALPSAGIQLRVKSTEYVTAKPGYARWISVQKEKPGTISQLLVASDGQDFDVLRSSALPAGVTSTVSSTKKEGSGKEWKLDLTLGEDAPVGAIVGTWLVYVNHPKQKVVPIPLSGFMRPVMAVTPNKLSFGELTLTEKRSQAFTVKSFSTEPIRVTKVEHDLKGFLPASLETRTLGREYRIKLDFDPATMPKGALSGTLKIYTDSAKMPLLTVPIDGTIH